MCGFNCVYHDLNVCYYGRPMLNKKNDQNKYNHIKLRLLQFLQMLLILKINKNVPLHPNSSYYQMCISKRQKKVILLLILSGNPNLFLDLKQYQSLEHAATKKLFFLVRYLFC